MNLEELKHRDNVIRFYLLNRNWDKDKSGGDYPEFELMRKIAASNNDELIYNGLLTNYPFIYDYEYRMKAGTEIKKGDLLLTDGNDNFLVLETKSLKYKTGGKRRLARRDLEKQVPMMIKILKNSLERCDTILGIGVTDEEEPFYIHVSSKFKDDRLNNLQLPNLELIQKNPVDALKEFCTKNNISEPEYIIKDDEYHVKIILDDQELLGIHKSIMSFITIIDKFYAAADLCNKLDIPYDKEFGMYF